MMILFDLVPVQINRNLKYHGGGEYTKAILFEFLKNKKSSNVAFILKRDLKTPKDILDRIKKYKIFFLEELEEHLKLNEVKKIYIGIINNYTKIKFSETIQIIVTIHDLRTFEIIYDNTMFFYKLNYQHFIYGVMYRICSNNFYLENFIKKIRKRLYFNKFKNIYRHRNKKIITDSNHSKQMLLLNFQEYFNNKQIGVYYPPEKIRENLQIKEYQNKIKEKDFYLILSSDRLEKNAIRAIKAIDELITKKLIFRKTIILGKLKQKVLNKIKNKEAFINLDYVSTEELEELYQKCYTLIYPTISEGFGYPPLEVMKYKKPTIVSAITSLTEIFGEAPLYFNPFSIEEIQVRILELENIYNKKVEVAYKKYLEVSLKQKEDFEKIIKIITEE